MSAPSRDNDSHGPKLSLEMSWDVLKELGASERHFNGLETEYRKLASIWLLAGFAGIGFIIKERPELVVPRELAIMGVGLAASIGIFLLWVVDLLVYHRLLDACFTEAQRIEASYPQLPKVRLRMAQNQGVSRVVTSRLRWFYIVLTAAPIAFATPLFVLWCRQHFSSRSALIATLTSAAYVSLTTLMIGKKGLRAQENRNPVQFSGSLPDHP